MSDCLSRAARQCIDFPTFCDYRLVSLTSPTSTYLVLEWYTNDNLPIISEWRSDAVSKNTKDNYEQKSYWLWKKASYQPKFVIMDWDISTSHKENSLCREKGLELRAIYNPLLGLSNNEAYHFLYFFISNFKICFCFKLWIIYISLWSVLVLIISNKNIEKLELTKCPTQRDLKISQVEDVQFCCSGVTCKNK